MSGGGLCATRLLRMHEVMERHVERGVAPGLVTLISRRGAVCTDVIGSAEFGGYEPMRRDTIFRISSMTKPIVAAATLSLVEECRLRLDEPVDRLLPELADRKVLERLDGPVECTVPARRPISVRDLLTMRMGFGYIMASTEKYPILRAAREQQLLIGPVQPQLWPEPDEWIRRVAALPLMHHPGERWMYDLSADVLGVLVARAADQPLEECLRERLFDPMEMNDTGFSVSAAKLKRLAACYHGANEHGPPELYDGASDSQWSRPPPFASAAAGLVSTVDDYLAFARMLLNKGRHGNRRILSRLSIEAMTTDQLKPEQRAGTEPFLGENRSWGMGLSIFTARDDVSAVPGRFGWDGGLGTSFSVDPREEMVSILMTQRALYSPGAPELWMDFWTCAYQAIDD